MLTAKGESDNGCIVNTAVQVASEPIRLAVSVQMENLTREIIESTGKFNVSVLTEEVPFETIRHFGMQSGRDVDKFADFADINRSGNGLLYLTKAANMYMSCKVTEHFDLGSHTLFIAELTDGVVLSDAPSCTYGFYQSDIKPKPQAQTAKKSWTCTVCGYVYEGDEVPDDFECPLCHHGKEDFVLN